MRSEEEVRARIQQVLYEEVSRRVDAVNQRLPHKCVHNYRHPLDARRRVDGDSNPEFNRVTTSTGLPVLQNIGLCMLGSDNPEEWSGTICDEPIDARRCPVFTPAKTKEQVVAELAEQIQDPEWVGANMPELASLLWVMEQSVPPQLPWWRRLLLRLRRPRLEPVEPPFDPSKLLPSGG